MNSVTFEAPAARTPKWLGRVLALLAAAVALLGTATAILVLLLAAEIGPWQVIVALLTLTGAWTVSAMLAAVLWLIDRFGRNASAQEAILASLQSAPASPAAAPLSTGESPSRQEVLDRLLAEVQELSNNMLLSDKQREAKRRHRQWQIAERLAAEAEAALDADQFDQAEQLLERLVNEVPDDPRYEQLNRRLADERAKAESVDIAAQTRRVEDLMAVGAFDQAEQISEDLLARWPSATQAIALLDRIRRQRQAYTNQQRQRLYGEVEEQARARQWQDALAAAQRLMQAYPDSSEAETVAAQIDTLRENAHIEQVRQIRDRIRELIEARRYVEALNLANDVVRRFPETQAAHELSSQIDKLRDLARKGEG